MMLVLAVLLALVGVTVAWDAKKAAVCHARINAGIKDKSLDPVKIFEGPRSKSFVYDQCMAQNWLVSIYHKNNALYKKWAQREQLKVGLEDVMLRDSLKKCLQKYAAKQFWGNELQFILDSYKLMQDNPKDQTARTRACEILDVYGFEASSKEANLAYKKRINLVQKVMPKLWGELKLKYKIDTLQKEEKKAALKLANNELIKFDEKKKALCLADPAKVDAKKAFKEGYGDVKSMILRGGFPTFWGSNTFKECTNAQDVARDLASFSNVQSNFCKEESNAYWNSGDKKRKQETIKSIQEGWKNKCKENPDFDPKSLKVRRVQAPVRDEFQRNNRQKPMAPRTPKVKDNGKVPPPPEKKGLPEVPPTGPKPPVPSRKSGPPPKKGGPPPKKGLPKVTPPTSPNPRPKPPVPSKKSGPPRRTGNPKAPPKKSRN
jgi:hypothetical protein